MSNVNNQFKELVNEAIHNHFNEKTETEIILKDWLYGICEQLDEYEDKSKAWDRVYEAFDAILKSYEEASHEGQMVYEISNIIEKYESNEAGTKHDYEKKAYKCTCGAKYYSMDNFREHLTNCFDG